MEDKTIVGDFLLAPDETWFQCPYNLSHRLASSRKIIHLNKCRKEYLKECDRRKVKPNMSLCRFNATHQLPKIEMEVHENSCREAFSIIKTLEYHAKLEDEAAVKVEEPDLSASGVWGEDEEDWETGSKGYDPAYDLSEKLESLTLYQPAGLTKGEKKAFRMQQRRKAQDKAWQQTFTTAEDWPKIQSDIETTERRLSNAKSVGERERILSPQAKKDDEDEEFTGEDPFS